MRPLFVLLAFLAGPSLSARADVNLGALPAPSGWPSPIVPRVTGDASSSFAPLPAVLPGDALGTYLNWSAAQTGPDAAPPFSYRIRFDDGPPVYPATTPCGPCPPGDYQQLNVGPVGLSGGRHTIRLEVDPAGAVTETNESDNVWSGQWVWSPRVLTHFSPLTHPAPPPAGELPLPNCDGFKFERDPGFAWFVAMTPTGTEDDYDLSICDDYEGSQSGFSQVLGSSLESGNATDFVVGHYDGTPSLLYPTVVRFAAQSEQDYVIDQGDAVNHDAFESGEWANIELAPARLADIFEAYFYSGRRYYLVLDRLSGTVDLGLALFSGTPGGVSARSGAQAAGIEVGALRDSISWLATESGWHPLLVFRKSSDLLTQPVSYQLRISGSPVTAVESPATPSAPWLMLGPNPGRESVTIRYGLSDNGPGWLEIFDLGGRRVHSESLPGTGDGVGAVRWDCRTGSGRKASAGLYFVRVTSHRATLMQRLMLIN